MALHLAVSGNLYHLFTVWLCLLKADTKGKKRTRTIHLKTRSLLTLGGIARDGDV